MNLPRSRRGTDPTIKDTAYDATPLGWAEHGGKHGVAAYLRNLR